MAQSRACYNWSLLGVALLKPLNNSSEKNASGIIFAKAVYQF